MRKRFEPDRILERHQQRRHPCKDLVIARECPDFSAELALIVEGSVVGLRLRYELHPLAAKRQLHGDPDIIEDDVFRQSGEIGASHHRDRAGHADDASEMRLLLPDPVLIAPVDAAAGFTLDDEITGRATHVGIRKRVGKGGDGIRRERLPDVVEQNQFASRDFLQRVQACRFSMPLGHRDDVDPACCCGRSCERASCGFRVIRRSV